MIRNFKALGLGLVAALALSAMTASAASAEGKYQGEEAHLLLKGTQLNVNKFSVPGAGTVECATSEFHGTTTATVQDHVLIEPTYTNCTAFGNPATINTTACDYTFETPTSVEGHTKFHAPVQLVCSGGVIEIKFTVLGSNCTMTIGSQTPTGVVDYHNLGSGSTRDVRVNSTVTGIAYERHGGGFCVFLAKNGTGNYTGEVTLKATNTTGTQKGVWITPLL